MIDISGKSLITTDWHFGLKNNSDNRLKILARVTKEICRYMKENGIDNFIFCGDWFHSRNAISVNTINIAQLCLEKISSYCKNVYMIIGNHDIFQKNSVDINSVKMFKHMKNVTIVKESTECTINGKRCLMVPWLGNTSYAEGTFDMMFGHFDISPKFLVSLYMEDCTRNKSAISELKELIKSDEILSESGLEDIELEVENKIETYMDRNKSSDLLGDWIRIVREGGTIFAGHIHSRSERYASGRKFIFVGSPYQQTRSEMHSNDGFYVLDENGSVSFNGLDCIPRFIDIKMSDIIGDVDGYDFDVVKGNIIHKIYDVDIDRKTEAKITQKILISGPFEEIPPDYMMSSNSEITHTESIDAIRKSKLDYLVLFINSIDDKTLDERGIDRYKLTEMMTEYYNQVTD